MRPLLTLPLLAALAAAGCGSNGGAPRLARADVAPLIRLADRISHEGPCAQARDIRDLDRQRTALVSSHRVPTALASALSSGVDALVEQSPVCVPAVARSTSAPEQPATTPVVPGEDRQERHGKHEHGHGHGHKHGHGDEGGD